MNDSLINLGKSSQEKSWNGITFQILLYVLEIHLGVGNTL